MIYKKLFEEIRDKEKINKAEFAEKLGLTRQYLDKLEKLENPATGITQSTIKKFKDTFNVNPNYLLTGEGSMFLDQPPEHEQEETGGMLLKRFMEQRSISTREIMELLNISRQHVENITKGINNLTQAHWKTIEEHYDIRLEDYSTKWEGIDEDVITLARDVRLNPNMMMRIIHTCHEHPDLMSYAASAVQGEKMAFIKFCAVLRELHNF